MKLIVPAFLLIFALITSAAPSEVSFKKKDLEIKNVKLKVEVAETSEQHSRGLMFRTQLKDDEGMIFIFSNEEPRSFWMKNTFIPLSVGFFDAQKKLIDIQEMQPVKSEMEANPPSYTSSGPAQFVLEVPKGWFTRKKIKIGDAFRLQDKLQK